MVKQLKYYICTNEFDYDKPREWIEVTEFVYELWTGPKYKRMENLK